MIGKIFLMVMALAGVCVRFYGMRACAEEPQSAYDDGGRRNPFLPLVTAEGKLIARSEREEQSKPLLLQGIMTDGAGRSFAVINGEVVSAGSPVGPYKVEKIERGKAVLHGDGGTVELILDKEEEEK